jgi:basic amino acid/polyamine antiporter, APA family
MRSAMGVFTRKPIDQLIAESADPSEPSGESALPAHAHGLKRTLGATQLTMLGIGAIIGAGIFSLTGAAAAYYAGPGVIFSFILGGILCALAGLCYAEMAAMVPVSGSAYAYSYATMGEIVAWIIGWDLVLEYAFGATTVAISWSGYFQSMLVKTLGIHLSDSALRFTKGPWELVTLSDGTQVHGAFNLPAALIIIGMAAILYRGMRESALVNNVVVVIKVTIVILFILLGWAVVDRANWVANPDASGLSSLVPAPTTILREGRPLETYGWSGVLTGAGVVFFAYIGFDALSTTAQECKNPKRDLPIGILLSLAICTALYILMSLVITGVVPYAKLGVPDPVAVGVDRIVELRGWSAGASRTLGFVVKLGALAGLTSVMLVLLLGQTRVFYAMAKDGLLPWFDRVHPKHKTPHIATLMTGGFVSLCAGLIPLTLVGELVSIGTLLAFVLVCAAIPILRRTQPDTPRPFKTPAYWIVAPAGALSCLWVMSGLPGDTWIRLAVWLVIGLVIYVTYGRKHSKVRAAS